MGPEGEGGTGLGANVMDQLRSGRPPVVALVTGYDDYQRRILRAASRELDAAGLPLIVHADGPQSRALESPLLRAVLERFPISGLLSLDATFLDDGAELRVLLDRQSAPVVHLGPTLPGRTSVRGDNETGMRALMRHLLEARAPRRIALARGYSHQADSVAREDVVREELHRHGIELDEELVVEGAFASEETYIQVAALLSAGVDMDAVVALNDRSALGAVAAITDAGLRVPEDIAVTGFDNEPAAARWPGLTTVDQGIEEQGTVAARLLLERIDHPDTDGVQVTVPSRLVVRGSTAPPGQAPVQDLETAIAMARMETTEATSNEGFVSLNYALGSCWSVDHVSTALGDHLTRLGITRAFIALYDRDEGAGWLEPGQPWIDTGTVRLVLDHRDGLPQPLGHEPYPAWQLLPPALQDELNDGLLLIQPLSVVGRALGFLLVEQVASAPNVSEMVRLDLSRALDVVLTTEESHQRTTALERAVEQRTQELEAEVTIRRHAERELQAAYEELRRSASLDGLTRIANRAAFQEHLERHWEERHAEQSHIALLLVDVDEFKAYNDRYGHVLGDQALRAVAAELAGAARGPDDLACRFGGEEFAVVLPGSDLDGALAVATRFRDALQRAAIPHETSSAGQLLTASTGVAVTGPGDDQSPEELLEAADQALYRAKHAGRDRIEVAPPPARPPEGVRQPRNPLDSRHDVA